MFLLSLFIWILWTVTHIYGGCLRHLVRHNRSLLLHIRGKVFTRQLLYFFLFALETFWLHQNFVFDIGDLLTRILTHSRTCIATHFIILAEDMMVSIIYRLTRRRIVLIARRMITRLVLPCWNSQLLLLSV